MLVASPVGYNPANLPILKPKYQILIRYMIHFYASIFSTIFLSNSVRFFHLVKPKRMFKEKMTQLYEGAMITSMNGTNALLLSC